MNANSGAGVTMYPVNSSNIVGVGADGKDLVISFKGKGTSTVYHYTGAGEHLETIRKLNADGGSVGKWLNEHIRGKYPSVKQ